MNILLVYPENPPGLWNFDRVLRKYSNFKSGTPPLGLLTVAAMLPTEWNQKLINLNICKKLKNKDIQWADFVFISAVDTHKDAVRIIIDRCKALGVKIVAGGPLFTCHREYFDDIDHLLLHEGEISVPKFLEDLENNRPQHIYDHKDFSDIKQSPVPKWDLVNVHDYARLMLQCSRGCPFNCDFCTFGGGHVRSKTTEQIISEMEAIYATGWRGSLFLADDNFIGNKKNLKEELLPALIEWQRRRDYPFTFGTEASINIVDDEYLINLMAEAGFDTVFLGIESADPESLIEANKTQNMKRDVVDCVKRIHQYGLQVMGGFILGFDSDKPAVFEHMIRLIQTCGIVNAMVGLLNARAGSRLYDRMKEEGRIISDFPDTGTNIVPKMDMDVLLEGQRKVIHTLYSPKLFYKRIQLFLESYRPRELKHHHLTFQEMVAFCKVCFHLGILNKGRKEYWKLIKWSYSKGRNSLALAVTLVIYGCHLRRYLK